MPSKVIGARLLRPPKGYVSRPKSSLYRFLRRRAHHCVIDRDESVQARDDMERSVHSNPHSSRTAL
jgi:hypothetical protein